MLELSRRQMIASAAASAAAASLASGVPAFAAAGTGQVPTGWNLTDLYPTDAAWEAERKSIQAAIPHLLQYKGKLGNERGGAAKGAAGCVRPQPPDQPALHLCLAQGRCRPQELGQPGEEAAGAGRVHRARRSDVVDEPRDSRGRRAQDPRLHCRQQRPHQVPLPARGRAAASAAHPVPGRGSAACQLGQRAGGAGRHPGSARLVRHSAPDGHAVGRQQDAARRPGLYDRALVAECAPTASWCSTNSGRATRRSKARSATALASQVKGEMFQAKARNYGSALECGAERRQHPRGRLPDAGFVGQRGASRPSPLFRLEAADARTCPTWAITTSIRRW